MWESLFITITCMATKRASSAIIVVVLAAFVLPGVAQSSRQQPKSAPGDTQFSDAVAAKLLEQVRVGLETLDPDAVLAAFDRSKMPDYDGFRDQLRSFFAKYQQIRVHYKITQTWVQNDRGIVLTEFDMEAAPQESEPPSHPTGQLRFEMQRGQRGWKIVEISPRGFFS
jgi:hypothetical protein